jgi:lipoate-protein ligase A
MKLTCVNDIARKCCTNIALDEIFFTKENFEEIFRFYKWTQPSYTIGYFQKFPLKKDSFPVVRRLTGGLSVLHEKDLSYSLIVSDKIWPYIYNQEKTYKIIHETIKKTLEKINIFCDNIKDIQEDNIKNYSCVQTLYKDDLLLNGKKIVGSCQRRRGKRILVEGSIHLNLSSKQTEIFTQEFFKNLANYLNCDVFLRKLNDEEIFIAESLCKEKYDNDKWNKLF